MWIWIAAQVAAVAVVVAVAVRRRRRVGGGLPRYPAPAPQRAHDARVSWPRDGMRHEGHAERRADAFYFVWEFPDRAASLAFLRDCEVRQERVYVIAENPEGNLGKDLIMIFEEADGSFVELAERSAAPRGTRQDCGRCGYPVLPVSETAGSSIVFADRAVQRYFALDELERGGHGFRCRSCRALGCAHCYRAANPPQLSDGSLVLHCWICRSEVEPDPF